MNQIHLDGLALIEAPGSKLTRSTVPENVNCPRRGSSRETWPYFNAYESGRGRPLHKATATAPDHSIQ